MKTLYAVSVSTISRSQVASSCGGILYLTAEEACAEAKADAMAELESRFGDDADEDDLESCGDFGKPWYSLSYMDDDGYGATWTVAPVDLPDSIIAVQRQVLVDLFNDAFDWHQDRMQECKHHGDEDTAEECDSRAEDCDRYALAEVAMIGEEGGEGDSGFTELAEAWRELAKQLREDTE